MLYTNANKGSLPYGSWYGANTAISTTKRWRWPHAVLNAMNSKAGMTVADANASGSVTNLSWQVMMCPEVPANQAATTDALHYLCHPRLMPSVDVGDNPILCPYKLGGIKEASERVLLMDGSLVLSSPDGVVAPYNKMPVALKLDGNRLSWTAKLTTMMWQPGYAFSVVPPGDSIDMTPYKFTTASPLQYANTDDSNNNVNVRFRHGRDTKANCLMADGHVETYSYDKSKAPADPRVTNLLRRYVYVNEAGNSVAGPAVAP
jgi:prepilin-type processing-associated H-X9-DG protein